MMAIPWKAASNMSLLSTTSRPDTPMVINIEIMRTFQFLCYGIFGQAMAVFGIGTNIINIICFVRQGFRESITVSLLGLAVSDLGCLITIIWMDICMIPAFQEADLPFDPLDTQHLTAAMPHIMFTRATAVITAFITLERCLCITLPLKVRSMFRPKRVAIINLCIFATLFVCFSPVYYTARLDFKYFPERNKTIVGIVSTEDRITVEQVSFAINSVLIPSVALCIITVCMVTMVTKLQRQTKWRHTHGSSTKTDGSSVHMRELNLGKMIVTISTLFVVCFLPSVIILLFVTIHPEFNVGGKYVQISVFAYGFSTVAESTNSSMNIFIYYSMSSKYRSYFNQIFRSKISDVSNGADNHIEVSNSVMTCD